MNRIPFGLIANFLIFAEGKTSKFPLKESDNFPCEARLCPKAIKIKVCNPAGDFVVLGAETNRQFAIFITIQNCSSRRATLPQIAKAYLSPAGLLLWDYHLTKSL